MTCVLGASVHYGRAEVVAVALDEGGPRVLGRWTAVLSTPGVPSSPYHHEALRLPLAEAEALVATARTAVGERCTEALRDACEAYGATALSVERSPYEVLPDSLSDVLASWPLTCAADGMLYREMLAECAAALGMQVFRHPRKLDLLDAAAERLGCDRAEVDALLKQFGATVGRPWRRVHREAAAAALLRLPAR